MGQAKSRENAELARKTHFTEHEIRDLRNKFEEVTGGKKTENEKPQITEEQFKETVKKYIPTVTPTDDAFLERLYHAFDVDNDKTVDFQEFVDGLSVFMKGTPEEKLELSFKLYDVDHDGYLTQNELEKVLTKLAAVFTLEDQTLEIKPLVARMFEDLDINEDGRLSLTEYKLSAMKEPLIVDFLSQFLEQHNLIPQSPNSSASPSANKRASTLSKRSSTWSLRSFASVNLGRQGTSPAPSSE